MDWFGEDFELVTLAAGLFQQICGRGLARKKEDFALWKFAASDDCSFDTGHAGHDDVADEHIGLETLERLDGLFSAKHGARLEARLVQDDCESVGNYLLVISNEYSGFGGVGGWICHSEGPQI